MSSILAKFLEHQRSSINCLNCEFLYLKLYIKIKFMDHLVNNILFVQNLAYVLRVQRVYMC